MDSSKATTVAQYLASLPPDRRAAMTSVRATVNASLPGGFVEGIQYGMISWVVPLERYPDTYNKQALAVASLASQKGHMALYLMGVYGRPDVDRWFRGAFAAAGKKLDTGKSCVRFKTLDALPLEVVGQAIAKISVADFIAQYEAAFAQTAAGKKRAAKAKKAAKAPAKAKAKAKATPKKPNAKARAKATAKPRR
jgi:uncharacterized protein YdhG (YjbR/CyaY superfamily)